MGKLIQFKSKAKEETKVNEFLTELDYTRDMFLAGLIDNVFIIATGDEGKLCTSSGVNIGDAKEMCRDFIRNAKEYID